jgi:hypothetical protein
MTKPFYPNCKQHITSISTKVARVFCCVLLLRKILLHNTSYLMKLGISAVLYLPVGNGRRGTLASVGFHNEVVCCSGLIAL